MSQNTRHFGAEVEARIKASGLTYREIQDETGIPLATLNRYLKSPDMTFRLGELSRLAVLLGTTAGAIITEFEDAA